MQAVRLGEEEMTREQGWTALVRELDGWTNDIILELDNAARCDRERMHCQKDDCYELADISDVCTSLRYCKAHYWEMRNSLAWKLFKSKPIDYHE